MKSDAVAATRQSVVSGLRGFFRGLSDDWNRFWFEPADPILLGLIRLLTGWMLFYNLLTWTLDLEAFFGKDGLQPLETIRRLHESKWLFSFWLWLDDQWMWPVHFTCLTIAALFFLGIATRVTSILAFLITISYSQRVPVANFGFDQILGMLCFYLCLGPSGACMSVDAVLRRWWRRRKGLSEEVTVRRMASARMSMRLIQLHMCAIYFWAGFSKLKGPSWWTGEAMWRVIANYEYQTVDLTWMANVPWLPYLIAHLTIVWEVFFIVLVWNRRLRPLVLFVGLGMHFGIGAFLGMWTFGLIMTFAYLAFSDPDVWRNRIHRLAGRINRSKHEPSDNGTVSRGIVLREPVTESASVCHDDACLSAAECTSEKVSGALYTGKTLARVGIVACEHADRSSLRKYFWAHGFDCQVVASPEDCLGLIARKQIDGVLIHGPGLVLTDVADLASELADVAGVPVLVTLTSRQLDIATRLDLIQRTRWMALPASLHEIRLQLERQLIPEGSHHG